MQKRIGRPLKYGKFLEILDDETVYCPSTIVEAGREHGLVPEIANNEKIDPEEDRTIKTRIRHALARFAANHRFPEQGDGLVKIKGQTPPRGWKGFRWKEAAGIHTNIEACIGDPQ